MAIRATYPGNLIMTKTRKADPSIQTMRTPPWLFNKCQDIIGEPFQLDAFASPHNALCTEFYTEEDNALEKPWKSPTFANPPFKLMGQVMEKACYEWQEHKVQSAIVGLTGCSQQWFHKYAIHATIYVPDKRIQYLTPDGTTTQNANRDSMVYVFNENSGAKAMGSFDVWPLHVR